MRPASDALYAMEPTGSVSFSAVGPIRGLPYQQADAGLSTVDSDEDMWITLTGDGSSLMQVFEVEASDVMAALSDLGCRNISVDLVNVPENASVVVNVHGDYDEPWRGGFRSRWDGVYCETFVDDANTSEGFKRFVHMASTIMWNFHDTSRLEVQPACGTVDGSHSEWVTGALFPGSFFVPYGDAHIMGSTNGHFACGGDLELSVWEHHNVPWRGVLVGFGEAKKQAAYEDWL